MPPLFVYEPVLKKVPQFSSILINSLTNPIAATAAITTASSTRSGYTVSSFYSTSSYGIFASVSAGEFLRVLFPNVTNIKTVTYRNGVGSSWAPTSVKIQSSLNGTVWLDEAVYSDNATTSLQTITVSTATKARYWRFYQNSNTRQNSSGYEWHFGSFSMSGFTI